MTTQSDSRLSESVYQHHPYGRSVLGTEPELMKHSPEAMRCFHRAHYQPENMTVVIVGGIAQKPALELVSRTFQQFSERCDCCPPQAQVVGKPVLAGIRRQELYLPRLEQHAVGWLDGTREWIRSAVAMV